MIVVHVSARLSQGGKVPSGNAIEASIKQCVANAVEGSFDEYPRHLRPMERLRARLSNDKWEPSGSYAKVDFDLGLPAELFPVGNGGLQHLVNLLSGDIFPTEVSGCQWSNVNVSSIDLPDGLRATAINQFRGSAHDIRSIRAAFRLPTGKPLLAFSLKPRVGPTFAEIRQLTLDVLGTGFNIVELDTRSLALSAAPIEKWLELGVEAALVGPHRTAFSPNLSTPTPKLVDMASAWVSTLSPYGPPVLKVDGGLDGLTSLQSIRSAARGRSPIVTSYPLLRSQLSSAIGPRTWTDLLALSGADIVYPGGRPTFPNERRPIWGAHSEGWSRAARRYDEMITRGWPMPTIAGGVHPGHLHALYELVGPNVAYFLGGAVALHPRSVRDGAKLCVAVLDAAVELAAEAARAGNDHARDLPARLLGRVERCRYPTASPNYFSPSNIFGRPGDDHSPLTFYLRTG